MSKEDLRFKQQKVNSMLKSIQINSTELCNRKCVFCPRSDPKTYPNSNKHISLDTIEKLCNDLNDINFNNRIGFAGFGEPLLHKDIFSCIGKVKEIIPNIKFLEIVTNGDKLNKTTIKKLYESGCNVICVSMYDKDKTEYFESLRGNIPIQMVYSHNYNKDDNYNINIVNRLEIIKKQGSGNNNPCYIPFYKAFIDWNGDILLCENDWSKSVNFGNIQKTKFKDIWYGDDLNLYRKILIKKRGKYPCSNCNACGTLRGIESVEIFKNSF